jgi:predicted nucleic acid-binding protein
LTVIVLDASVALKLVTPEPGSFEARTILDRDDERIAPDWLMVEVTSALANKVRYEGMDMSRATAALRALPLFVDRTVETAPMLEEALRLSVDVQHALYDCLYLLVALKENSRVLTADDGLVKAAQRAGFGAHVERLKWS